MICCCCCCFLLVFKTRFLIAVVIAQLHFRPTSIRQQIVALQTEALIIDQIVFVVVSFRTVSITISCCCCCFHFNLYKEVEEEDQSPFSAVVVGGASITHSIRRRREDEALTLIQLLLRHSHLSSVSAIVLHFQFSPLQIYLLLLWNS